MQIELHFWKPEDGAQLTRLFKLFRENANLEICHKEPNIQYSGGDCTGNVSGLAGRCEVRGSEAQFLRLHDGFLYRTDRACAVLLLYYRTNRALALLCIVSSVAPQVARQDELGLWGTLSVLVAPQHFSERLFSAPWRPKHLMTPLPPPPPSSYLLQSSPW